MPQLLANRALASPRRAAAHTDFGYGDLVSAGARQSTMANDVAAEGTSGPASAFPHLASIEGSFGRPVNAVAHTDTRAATAARSLGTKAFTIGRHVGFAESNPSLFVAAHEAAHAMQNSSATQAFGGAQQGSVDPMEAHANAVARRVVRGDSAENLLQVGSHAPISAVQCFEGDTEDKAKEPLPGDATPSAIEQKDATSTTEPSKQDSARFEGDKKLEDISAGKDKFGKGARGLQVTKMQQALIDLGYKLPRYGVDGKFGSETKAALLKFQKDHGVSQSGELDDATMAALNTAYDTRKPYIDKAAFDAAHPGTRALSGDDKAAAIAAMVPAKGAGGAPIVFTEEVAGKKYGDEMRDQLNKLIAGMHKRLYEEKAPLRADPAKNFHAWSTLEGPATAAKQVVDAVYDTNYGGPGTFPAMKGGVNLIDQWADEEAINAGMDDTQKLRKATNKVWYLINSNCRSINQAHGAVPSAPIEKSILNPVVEECVNTPAKVQIMLDLDIGWQGAQLEGTVYLQRYKSTDPDLDKAKESNRAQMWGLFQTCIHEYIHTATHSAYQTWANGFRNAGDETRYNTLIEGFCDFFTLNVRKTVKPDAALAATVEGPYANGNPPAPDKSGVYPSNREAEQVVSIVGIKNAQAAYFQGKIDLMGG